MEAPEAAQISANPTSALDMDALPEAIYEEGSYAVVLPERLSADGSWDVYRCGQARHVIRHVVLVRPYSDL